MPARRVSGEVKQYSGKMNTSDFTQTILFPVTPEQVYAALMTAEAHSRFTGSDAAIRDEVGADFSVFDGYAHGRNVELIPGQKIVQTWRANEENWPADHFSEVVFDLREHPDGAELTFIQTGVPEEYADAINQGWHEYYWEPMLDYFNAPPSDAS